MIVLAVLLLVGLLLLYDYATDLGLVARIDSVAGSLVVLTGAAGGLGRALALEFARRGAVVALWDVRKEALDECVTWLVQTCAIPQSSVHAVVVDVADAAAVSSAAATQLATIGPARIVVSNAATVNGEPLLDANEERLRTSFDVNTLSHLWVARALRSYEKNPVY